jgi:hypothetical protein
MKTKRVQISLLIVLLISSFFVTANAQTPLAAYKIGDVWTFLNSDGDVMFQAGGITELGGFSEGTIAAQIIMNKRLHWVYFDLKGNIKIKTDAVQGIPFNEGMAVIFDPIDPDKGLFKFGFVDSTGKIFKELQYTDALSFSEGLAYVMKKGERGYIDKTGKMVIPLDTNLVGYAFSEGLAAVSNDKFKVGFIDKSGALKIGFKQDIPAIFSEGLARVADTLTGKIGFINEYGVLTIRCLFDQAYDMHENRTMAGYYDKTYRMKWAMLNKKGEILTDFRFSHAKEFKNGAAVVLFDNRWGYIDSTGNFLFSNNYDLANSFAKDGLAWVVDGEKQGFINKSGKMVVELPKADYYFDLRFNSELKTSTKVELPKQ